MGTAVVSICTTRDALRPALVVPCAGSAIVVRVVVHRAVVAAGPIPHVATQARAVRVFARDVVGMIAAFELRGTCAHTYRVVLVPKGTRTAILILIINVAAVRAR